MSGATVGWGTVLGISPTTSGHNPSLTNGDFYTTPSNGNQFRIKLPDGTSPSTLLIESSISSGQADGAIIGMGGGSSGTGGGSVTIQLGKGSGSGVASGSLNITTTLSTSGLQGAVVINGPGAFLGLESRASMQIGVGGGSPGIWVDNVGNGDLNYRDDNNDDHAVAYAEFCQLNLPAPIPFLTGVPKQIAWTDLTIGMGDFGSFDGTGKFTFSQTGLYVFFVTVQTDSTVPNGSVALYNGNGSAFLGGISQADTSAYTTTGQFLVTNIDATAGVIAFYSADASGDIDVAKLVIQKIR